MDVQSVLSENSPEPLVKEDLRYKPSYKAEKG